jgi:hypothetical protein
MNFASFFEGFRAMRANAPAVATEPRIEFGFLGSVLRDVELYYLGSQLRRETQAKRKGVAAIRKKGKLAYSEDRRAAKKAVESLMRARTNGVGMANLLDNIKLFELLAKLGHELEVVTEKKRETAKSLQTKLVNDVAEQIALATGNSSPKLLKEFIRWVGFTVEDSNVGKISAAAKRHALAAQTSGSPSTATARAKTMQ